MKTMYNVGEEVLVKCTVREIHVNTTGEVLYMVAPVKPRYYGDEDDAPYVTEDHVVKYVDFLGQKIPIC